MKSIWIGFTGTPIFNSNKKDSNFIINSNDDTNYGYANITKAIFGNLLSIYNTRNAQNDNLVLGWRIKNIKLTKQKEINDIKLPTYTLIDTSAFYEDEARLKQIVHYINNTYPIYTKQTDNKNRELNIQSTRNGFTALLTCNNIASACKYYALFKQSKSVLRVGLLFSIDANYDNEDYTNDESFKTFHSITLLEAMRDFKALFKNESSLKNLNVDYYSTEAYGIYKTNLLTKFKRNEIDLIIVVRQLLTGFDAKTLNTLFVDKFLKEPAEIIQMFSRTNRVFDKVKTCGNIVMFRTNDDSVKDALSLYCSSNSANRTNEILQTMPEFNVIFNDDFKNIVNELKTKFPYSLDLYNRLTSRSNMAVENFDANNLPDFFKFALLFLRYKSALKDLKTYLEWAKVDDVYKISNDTYLDYANLYKQIKKVNRSLFDKINIAGDVDFNVYDEYELEMNKATLNNVLTRSDLSTNYVVELLANNKDYSEIFKSKLIKNFLIKHKEIEGKNSDFVFDKKEFVDETLKEISKKYNTNLENLKDIFNRFRLKTKNSLDGADAKFLNLKASLFNKNKLKEDMNKIQTLLIDLAEFSLIN